MIRINQLASLISHAGRYEILRGVSTDTAFEGTNGLMAFNFTGHINGNKVKDAVLMRKDGTWKVFDTLEEIKTIKGELESFTLVGNKIPR